MADLKLKTLAGTREGECWRVHFKPGGTPDLAGRDGQVRLFVQLVFRRREERKQEREKERAEESRHFFSGGFAATTR